MSVAGGNYLNKTIKNMENMLNEEISPQSMLNLDKKILEK